MAKGGGFKKPSMHKKARISKTPVGSVRVENGKRYVKTDKGWSVLKSVQLILPVTPKDEE